MKDVSQKLLYQHSWSQLKGQDLLVYALQHENTSAMLGSAAVCLLYPQKMNEESISSNST